MTNALFEKTEINGMVLANRFVRSATWAGMAADDGACTPRLIKLLSDLAAGQVLSRGTPVCCHRHLVRSASQGGRFRRRRR